MATQAPVKPQTPSEVLSEYVSEGFIDPGELRDILEAIKTIKKDTGWGKVELFYQNGEFDDHSIYIKRKATVRKKKDV